MAAQQHAARTLTSEGYASARKPAYEIGPGQPQHIVKYNSGHRQILKHGIRHIRQVLERHCTQLVADPAANLGAPNQHIHERASTDDRASDALPAVCVVVSKLGRGPAARRGHARRAAEVAARWPKRTRRRRGRVDSRAPLTHQQTCRLQSARPLAGRTRSLGPIGLPWRQWTHSSRASIGARGRP